MRILITILAVMLVSGCSAMLMGAEVAPAEQADTDEDEESRKER